MCAAIVWCAHSIAFLKMQWNEANWIESATLGLLLKIASSFRFETIISKYKKSSWKYSNSIHELNEFLSIAHFFPFSAFLDSQLEFYNSFVTNSKCEFQQNDQWQSLALFFTSHSLTVLHQLEYGTHFNGCTIGKAYVRCVCAYKFHLILSIRFFIGLNEQFTENLADIFKWMSQARYKCKCFVDMRIVYVRCEHLTLEKTFDSDFQVYFIGSVKTRWNFFSLSQNSFFVCLASEKRIKFEIAFGFVHLCLFLKTIVLVVCSVLHFVYME